VRTAAPASVAPSERRSVHLCEGIDYPAVRNTTVPASHHAPQFSPQGRKATEAVFDNGKLRTGKFTGGRTGQVRLLLKGQ
jgi:hypothetical protein